MKLNRLFALAAAMLGMGMQSPAAEVTLFSDSFDTDTFASWLVLQSSADTRVTFAYDHSADGIPAAPNSAGGTTKALKLEANLAAPPGVEAVSLSPSGQSFSGDYTLRFDMWINVNGPFPGGGSGSVEHLTAGIGTTGDHLQWGSPGHRADGIWTVVNGEGSGGRDFRIYKDGVEQLAASGAYGGLTDSNVQDNLHPRYAKAFPAGATPPAIQGQSGSLSAGTVGFAWRDVAISKKGHVITWSIDGFTIATIATVESTFADPGNIFVGYWDFFDSVSDNAAQSFGLVDNVRVTAVPEPSIYALAGFGLAGLATARRRLLAALERRRAAHVPLLKTSSGG